MRLRVFLLFPVVLFFLMLCFPELVLSGARDGLLLWFSTVLPTLFPFLVLSELLLRTNAALALAQVLSPLLSPLFRISAPASFAVLGGMLCGYPVGARITRSLVDQGSISVEEGIYLLDFVNQLSPAFFVSFVITQNLKDRRLLIPGLLLLYVVPVVMARIFRKESQVFLQEDGWISQAVQTGPKKREQSFTGVLDESISFASDALVHIGGYMILFSVLLSLADSLPISNFLWDSILLPSLEVSNGVHLLGTSSGLSPILRSSFLMFCCSFGGWCALFQTKYMLEGTAIPLKSYALKKLVTASVTSFLTYCYYTLFLL